MAFRGLEPSTLEAFAAFTRVSRATRDRSAPRNGLATQTPITYRSSNEHDGALRVANEKQGSARFRLNLRAEQGGMRGRVADSCTSVRMGTAASTPDRSRNLGRPLGAAAVLQTASEFAVANSDRLSPPRVEAGWARPPIPLLHLTGRSWNFPVAEG